MFVNFLQLNFFYICILNNFISIISRSGCGQISGQNGKNKHSVFLQNAYFNMVAGDRLELSTFGL